MASKKDLVATTSHMWHIMKFDITTTQQEAIKEIGSRLKSIRLGRNMTRNELSKRSGVPERTLARLEKGEGNVRLEVFVSVCSALALTEHFETLLPPREQTPATVFKKERLRRRARPVKKSIIVWGDEK